MASKDDSLPFMCNMKIMTSDGVVEKVNNFYGFDGEAKRVCSDLMVPL